MGSQTASCPTCKRLKNLKAAKVVDLLELVLNDLGRCVVLFFSIVIVAKCPVVATTTLLVECILLVVIPNDTTLRLFLCAETILHDFWLHINQDSIWRELVRFLPVTLEVCLDDPLPYELAAVLDFLEEGLEEGLSELVSTLSNLHCDYRH